jgi:hypothetical protein
MSELVQCCLFSLQDTYRVFCIVDEASFEWPAANFFIYALCFCFCIEYMCSFFYLHLVFLVLLKIHLH